MSGYVEVDPVHRFELDGKEYEYKYDFKEVHLEDITEVAWDGVDTEFGYSEVIGEYLRWHYKNKPAVYVTKDAVYREEDAHGRSAEKQAYHALSFLDSDFGVVSLWRKR